VDPSFFFGYEQAVETGFRMATPEKALVDYLYLAPARSGLFRALPELELPRDFSRKRAVGMIRKIKSAARKTMLEKRFRSILEG
jgi:hypothetical protein